MTVYLDKIKKEFLRRFTLYFLVFFIGTFLYLFFTLRNVQTSIVLLYGTGYLTLNILYYLIFRTLFNRYFNQKLGSQEIISRSIFKNTRMVINNISHELRTPLNAILGFASNLYETETDEEKKIALEAIRNNSERLFSMAQKLIDFSTSVKATSCGVVTLTAAADSAGTTRFPDPRRPACNYAEAQGRECLPPAP